MLSKEEIENSFTKIEIICKQEVCLFNQTIIEGNLNQIKRYIIQLESDKQKLIEILEKANKEDTNTVKYYEKQRRLTTDDFYKKSYQTQIHKANSRREVRKNILEIVKGENQVTVK